MEVATPPVTLTTLAVLLVVAVFLAGACLRRRTGSAISSSMWTLDGRIAFGVVSLLAFSAPDALSVDDVDDDGSLDSCDNVLFLRLDFSTNLALSTELGLFGDLGDFGTFGVAALLDSPD